MEIGLVVWLGLSVIAGVIASNKGRSGVGFFLLALILSPLIGIIAALVVAEDIEATEKQKLDAGTSKKCPFCAELIKFDATTCKHCKKDLPGIEEILNPMKELRITPDNKPTELDKLDKSGSSLLMIAAAKGNYNEVVSLLNDGANPLVKDKSGMTAKIRAQNRGNSKIVALLEKAESIVKKCRC